MRKRILKKNVVYVLFGFVFLFVFVAVFSIERSTSPNLEGSDISFVNKTIVEDDKPVVSVNNVIKRPYNDSNVKIVRDFYDFNDNEVEQENSIIFYEDTYLQSSGVSYSNGDVFDVLCILDGVVSSVNEDNILGTIVEIDHGNGIVAYYQSLSDVCVKSGDVISSGTVIGVSGPSNIALNLGNHLTFELSINGKLVNPEDYFDRNVSDI